MAIACGLAAAGWMSASCAPRSLVALATSPDQTVGRVSVSNAAGTVELDAANEATAVADANTAPGAPATLSAARVRELFGEALGAQPPAAIHFLLYFDSDSTDLRPDSAAKLPAILAALQQRGPGVVTVVGHSDTWGDKDYNFKLALRRAQAIKGRLVSMGVVEASVEVSSHGEANPLVPTGDNVKEDRNRRVEVVVR
jgi:outer membrane protein OmpA-like peptidoglycan-associated protein